jgi:hypothetical protein
VTIPPAAGAPLLRKLSEDPCAGDKNSVTSKMPTGFPIAVLSLSWPFRLGGGGGGHQNCRAFYEGVPFRGGFDGRLSRAKSCPGSVQVMRREQTTVAIRIIQLLAAQ